MAVSAAFLSAQLIPIYTAEDAELQQAILDMTQNGAEFEPIELADIQQRVNTLGNSIELLTTMTKSLSDMLSKILQKIG
jgi:hypothetical protein